MNIVIIDDDQLVALSLQTILEAADNIHVAATGSSGHDAIRLFDTHDPDVILMDIRMGDMNGLDASEAIIAAHPDAKILLLTTFSDDEYNHNTIMEIGYIVRKNMALSNMGNLYIEKIQKYLGMR